MTFRVYFLPASENVASSLSPGQRQTGMAAGLPKCHAEGDSWLA